MRFEKYKTPLRAFFFFFEVEEEYIEQWHPIKRISFGGKGVKMEQCMFEQKQQIL